MNVIQQIARKVFGAYRDTHQAHIASSLNKAAREFKLSIITLPGIEEILYESELPAADLTRIRKVIKYVKDNPCGATNVVQKRKPISEINAKYNDEPLSDVERKAKVKFNEKAQLSDTKRMDKLEDDREHSHANDIPKIQRLGGGEKLKGKRKFVKEFKLVIHSHMKSMLLANRPLTS
ncbi:MAG: hypothetical protein P0S94_02095, partial [Simkaniaceae bacterium]|nr:hypothetical protein [Simkaniaceae bacterium]